MIEVQFRCEFIQSMFAVIVLPNTLYSSVKRCLIHRKNEHEEQKARLRKAFFSSFSSSLIKYMWGNVMHFRAHFYPSFFKVYTRYSPTGVRYSELHVKK